MKHRSIFYTMVSYLNENSHLNETVHLNTHLNRTLQQHRFYKSCFPSRSGEISMHLLPTAKAAEFY